MRNRSVKFFCCLGVLTLLVASRANAEVYVYTDKDGNIEFTNVPKHKFFKPLNSTLSSNRSQQFTRRTAPSENANDNNSFRHRGEVSLSKIAKEIKKYYPTMKEASRLYKIPVSLIKAVIYAESAWDKDAVSPAGAQGLMQLMPATAKELGVTDPFDPYQNIMGGTLHLRRLANLFDGDVVLMIAGYNAGHNLVARLGKVPNIPETIDYTRKVLKMYRRFKQEEEQSDQS
ncbi:MAG: lytic transglycosylase domain-containing protein [Myxococcota bacterium]